MASPAANLNNNFEAQVVETPDGLYPHDMIITEGVDGLDAITDAHIQQFHEAGFLVVHNAFTPAEVEAALEGLLFLIDGGNPDFKGISFEARARDILDTLSADQKQDAVRKLMWFVNYDDRLKHLAQHPSLLGVVERLIGETPHMFQDMALLKPPQIGREKPWHQDSAYFNMPHTTTVVGVWVALDEAMVENGCMHIIPGSHQAGPVIHGQRRDWQICDTDVMLDKVCAVPLKPGGLLLFHGLLHHGTPPSRSTHRRRAVQYHYKPASVTLSSDPSQRLEIFGPEGKDVEC